MEVSRLDTVWLSSTCQLCTKYIVEVVLPQISSINNSPRTLLYYILLTRRLLLARTIDDNVFLPSDLTARVQLYRRYVCYYTWCSCSNIKNNIANRSKKARDRDYDSIGGPRPTNSHRRRNGGGGQGAPAPRFEGGGAGISFSPPGSGRDAPRPPSSMPHLHWDQYI